MNALLLGVIIVGGTTALACLGMLLIRKRVGIETLRGFNDSAGNIFQVVGTLYAVLLGLIVVDAMSTMSDLRLTVDQEADAVANIYIMARGMPPDMRTSVQKLTIDYVDSVIDVEWDAMQRNHMSTKAAGTVFELWGTLIDWNPDDPNQQEIRSMALDEMTNLGDNRRRRVIGCLHGISPVLWTALIVGAVLTIGFSYFFGIASLTGQMLMVAFVAISVSMNVYLVYLFGYPFSGTYTLKPYGFIADRAIFSMYKDGINPMLNSSQAEYNLKGIEDKQGRISPDSVAH